MSLANALKKAASASLKKLGGDVTIRQVTAGAYNTTTGAISESTSDTTIKGALSNVSRNQVNDLIESQDKLLTISAGDLTFVPTTKDRVVISNIEFTSSKIKYQQIIYTFSPNIGNYNNLNSIGFSCN